MRTARLKGRGRSYYHCMSRIIQGQMLLNDPVKAISNGYSGEQFNINSEEKVRLSTIRATSLADFAAQLSQV